MATLNGGSETLVQIWSQNLNSLNVYLFFFSKERYILCALPTWVNGRGLYSVQPSALLPPACRAQKVHDEFQFALCCLFLLEKS